MQRNDTRQSPPPVWVGLHAFDPCERDYIIVQKTEDLSAAREAIGSWVANKEKLWVQLPLASEIETNGLTIRTRDKVLILNLGRLTQDEQKQLLSSICNLKLLCEDAYKVFDYFYDAIESVPAHLQSLALAERIANLEGVSCSIPNHHQKFTAAVDEINRVNRQEILARETSLVPVTWWMRRSGLWVDKQALAKARNEYELEFNTYSDELQNMCGGVRVDPFSEFEVRKALKTLELEVLNTTSRHLSQNGGAAGQAIVNLRKLSNRLQVCKSLAESIGPDGCIHPDWNPLGTNTGRYTCCNPALQSIPDDVRIQRVIRARPGFHFIFCDYQAAELRPLAALTGDTALKEFLKEGRDIYREVAAILLGRNPNGVAADQRKLCKVLFQGIINGMGSRTLAETAAEQYGLELSADEAEGYINRLTTQFPGIAKIRRNQFTESSLPRCKQLKYLDQCITKLSYLLQGTVADAVKDAMVKLNENLPSDACVVANFHDEIVVEAKESEDTERQVMETMKESLASLLGDVDVVVGIKVSDTFER